MLPVGFVIAKCPQLGVWKERLAIIVYHSISIQISVLEIIEVGVMMGSKGLPQQTGVAQMKFVLAVRGFKISPTEHVERKVRRKVKR